MSVKLEAFLAKLYVDESARARFLEDPRAAATQSGLAANEIEAVMRMDLVGLRMTATSLRRKKEARRSQECDHP